MTKQNVAEPESLGEAMNRTELFFEKNGRKLTYVFLGLLVLAALVYGYRALIVAPRAEKAAEMIAEAQSRFEAENPDFELALQGDANGAGFLDVIEQYGSTPSGNLASTMPASATCVRAIWRMPPPVWRSIRLSRDCPAHSSMPRTTGCRAMWPSSGRTTPRPWISTARP